MYFFKVAYYKEKTHNFIEARLGTAYVLGNDIYDALATIHEETLPFYRITYLLYFVPTKFDQGLDYLLNLLSNDYYVDI